MGQMESLLPYSTYLNSSITILWTKSTSKQYLRIEDHND